MFGVSLQRAIEQLKRNKIEKSEFYLANQSDDIHYASLLLHIKRRKHSNGGGLALEAWQYCPGHSEVFYLHAESPNFETNATHMDCATIMFSPDNVKNLFVVCNKIKGQQYQKHFRLDGNIPINEMFRLASFFFPITELVEEAFEIGAVEHSS